MFAWLKKLLARNGEGLGMGYAEAETTDEVLAQPSTKRNASKQSKAITSKMKKLVKDWDNIDKMLGGGGECGHHT
jgi:DNA integrity scanning protein DisA with diadenylate cyclase activity